MGKNGGRRVFLVVVSLACLAFLPAASGFATAPVRLSSHGTAPPITSKRRTFNLRMAGDEQTAADLLKVDPTFQSQSTPGSQQA
jgi:hypothetical protein